MESTKLAKALRAYLVAQGRERIDALTDLGTADPEHSHVWGHLSGYLDDLRLVLEGFLADEYTAEDVRRVLRDLCY